MTTRRGFFGFLAGFLGGVVFAKPLISSAGETRKRDSASQEIPRAYSTARNYLFKTTFVYDGESYEKLWFINHEHWIEDQPK